MPRAPRKDDRTRVLVAHTDPLVRAGVRAVLQRERDLVVNASCGTFAEVPALLEASKAQVAILDARLRNEAPDYLARLRTLRPDLVMIVLSPLSEAECPALRMHGADPRVMPLSSGALEQVETHCIAAIRQGARAALHRGVTGDVLVKTVRTALAGATVPPPPEASAITTPRGGGGRVTAQEMRIALEVAQGRTNREIAVLLGITEQTVKNHLRRLMEKLRVHTRTELARFTIDHHLA